MRLHRIIEYPDPWPDPRTPQGFRWLTNLSEETFRGHASSYRERFGVENVVVMDGSYDASGKRVGGKAVFVRGVAS